jgi:hypothetical protein
MAIEVIYLRNLLENMGFPQDPDTQVYYGTITSGVIGGLKRPSTWTWTMILE